ncbi:DUF3667 domain-containing protein [Novosphingobium panipatense]|uniref:DUF3667 domain-containing protein n=1 Tax=Novosphingobium panipatense TaxID=428991 RepID=A0ABY1QQI5_9SPHN|nr:DUF3667 domain-containing protein [Novosphingobium panipatense]SMP78150.1 Protein of unknown function [Novosphingobium panipatense]
MSGIGEGVADLGQGVLTASALEKEQRLVQDGHTHESACLNCGTALVGTHCHACGQAAHVHRTLGAFFHDLLHGVFHFEGKTWRTLPLLAWKPGELTRQYVEGRRASFVSPIALFLFSVFLMFAVFHSTQGGERPADVRSDDRALSRQVDELEGELARLQDRRKLAASKGQTTQELDEEIGEHRDALAAIRAAQGENVDVQINGTRFPRLTKAVQKFRANPDLAIYKIQTYAYKYSWALIPISVPFLWLLFPFSGRFHLYDHTVFVTYSLCFMTMIVILAMVLGAVGAGSVAPFLFFVPPVHMYRQLRGAYALSRRGAVWRTFLLIGFAATALALFFVLIMAQTSF